MSADWSKRIEDLPAQEETRTAPRLHGSWIDLIESYPAAGDLSLLVAGIARPGQRVLGECGGEGSTVCLLHLPERCHWIQSNFLEERVGQSTLQMPCDRCPNRPASGTEHGVPRLSVMLSPLNPELLAGSARPPPDRKM